MPLQFSFDASTPATAGTLERGDFTTGSYPGLDYPTYFSAVAPNQSIATSGGVDVVALTMVAGQNYKFDIDNSAAALDLELDIINQKGIRVSGNDDSGGTDDPFLSFTAAKTGTYFIAIHHTTNDYVDGSFRFEGTPTPTGAYQLAISTQSLPALKVLSNSSDTYYDTAGAHRVKAYSGNDYVALYDGNDIGLGHDGADTIYGGTGMDEISGGSGADSLIGDTGDDVLRGSLDNDRLYGGDGNDELNGGSGNDLVSGNAGNDVVWGESGNDTVFGGDGNDFLRGGSGLDLLYGGNGVDTFHFLPGEAPASDVQAEDRIEDFQIGDQIDLSDLVWGTLTWRGTSSFSAANQVRIVELSNGYTDVRVNLDTDSTAEFEVLVKPQGGFDLMKEDFIL